VKVCPSCNERFSDDANFCPMDAAALTALAEAPLVPAAPAPIQTPPANDLLASRYRPLERIGESALGELFAAKDTRDGAAIHLLYVAAPVFSSPLALERTQRELRQLEKVPSEGIGRVFDHGRLPDGRLWIASEPPQGETLAELVQRGGPLPLERAGALVAKVGEALLEAQKGGVIHRDVHPGNVYVLPGDRIRLVNFGLALPQDEQVSGEPHYLSPEQAAGKPVDQRSNIYSLGAILYHLVCGQPPFLGDAPSLLSQHQTAEPVPPSKRRPDLPAAFDNLLAKALAKSPTRRHLTLRQFVRDAFDLSTRRQGQVAAPIEPAPPAAQPAAAPAVADAARTMMMVGAEVPLPTAAPAAAVMPPVKPAAVAVPIASAPVPAPVAAAPDPAAVGAATIIAIAPPTPDLAPAPGPTSAEPAPAVEQAPLAAATTDPLAKAIGEPQEAGARESPAAAPAPVAEPPGGQFRETLWFAKGEVAGKAITGTNGESASPLADERPLEDRYRDDGKLSREEAQRLSLRQGAAPKPAPAHVPARRIPGERMDTTGIAKEMMAGQKRNALLFVGILVVFAAAVLFVALR